ncbi:MAG: hypothetical protein IKM46_06925 [Clostridia bacterium]|nr:hypothetical protein [Clostridia bacterium]
MKRSSGSAFPFVYFIYVCLLIVASIASIIYVKSLLDEYEMSQPSRKVEEAIELLKEDAKNGVIWNNITFPDINQGEFEKDINLKEQYALLLSSDELEYKAVSKSDIPKNEKVYSLQVNELEVAELTLEADGDVKSRLLVFHIQHWKIKSVRPVISAHNYTLSVPSDYTVKINGIRLTEADGEKVGETGMDYKLSSIYLIPKIEISDSNGNVANYKIRGNKIIPELYNYSLTLPAQLTVELNGEIHEGETLEDGSVRHDIRLLTKPTVKISDCFGNKITYEGGNKLPLTYLTLHVNSRYTVKVDGADVPPSVINETKNSEFESYYKLSELGDESLDAVIKSIPMNKEYKIAILKDNAEVTVKDNEGNIVDFDKNAKIVDLTALDFADSVPEDIAAEIDVLDVAGKYHLLMSNDLKMNDIKNYLVTGTYQYEEATKYAGGVDSSFTSPHTLKDPIFSSQAVLKYVPISSDCFAVDVNLVKPMDLLSGGKYWKTVEDIFSERLYFVRYDDPNNNSDSYSWKLVGMRALGDVTA